jgi:hypothetical protein
MSQEWITNLTEDIKQKGHEAAENYGREQHKEGIIAAQGAPFFTSLVLCLEEDINEIKRQLQGDVTAAETTISGPALQLSANNGQTGERNEVTLTRSELHITTPPSCSPTPQAWEWLATRPSSARAVTLPSTSPTTTPFPFTSPSRILLASSANPNNWPDALQNCSSRYNRGLRIGFLSPASQSPPVARRTNYSAPYRAEHRQTRASDSPAPAQEQI